MADVQLKRCSTCQQEKPPADFCRSRGMDDGLHYTCRACRRIQQRSYFLKNRARLLAKQKKYRAANTEKCNATVRAWMKVNRPYRKAYEAEYRKLDRYKHRAKIRLLQRRARKRGLPATWNREHAAAAETFFGGRCAVCGESCEVIHWDHWVPLSSSACPGTVPGNMVPLCALCNLRKAYRDAAAWLAFKFSPTKAARVVSRIDRFFQFIQDWSFDMSFANKPNRPDSKDTARLRVEYEKKAREVRDTTDPVVKVKLRDEKAKLFQKVVDQQVHERRENLKKQQEILASMGRFKTDEQVKAERAKAEAAKAQATARG